MIQIFHFQVPLDGRPPDPLIEALKAKSQRVVDLYPALCGLQLQASEGFLHMWLRCAGRDRWYTLHAARTIAVALLNRVKLEAATITMLDVVTEKNRTTLTKDTGRNPNHTPRSPGKQRYDDIAWRDDLQSPVAPADPS